MKLFIKNLRQFNENEKEFIKSLVEVSASKLISISYFLQEKYFIEKSNSALIVLPKERSAILYISKEHFDNLDLREIEFRRFMEILLLIEHLKNDKYIDIIPNLEAENTLMHILHKSFNKQNQDVKTSNISLNEKGMHLKHPDVSKIYNSNDEVEFIGIALKDHTYRLIIDNLMGGLFVSQELINFVKKGFRSTQDRRYRNGQITTWTGLTLALAFGVFGLYNPFDKSKDIKLIPNPDNLEIKKDIQNNVKEIKTSIEEIIVNDSIFLLDANK
jgi:hypothetical protein